MCGIAALIGGAPRRAMLDGMLERLRHRGPDATGVYADPLGEVLLGHTRLSIIDLSQAAGQPMTSADGRFHVVLNGEIYNYRELRAELAEYPFRTASDTEVLLAAFARWGTGCLDRLLGMFAFAIWDSQERRLIAARDRFGVKPLFYHLAADGTLMLVSEIKALWAAGAPAEPNAETWAGYLVGGAHEEEARTFWRGIHAVPAGHLLEWHDGQIGVRCWYDLANERTLDIDERSLQRAQEEYLDLLCDSVRLRFRADVPVGLNLSGGLDSSLLLGLVDLVQGRDSALSVFTFVTGDARYDELPWVEQALARTPHQLVVSRLSPADVPALAASVQEAQDEPFGGIPTLAYAQLFGAARERGITVVLDGQGMDEQWAGYDYYRFAGAASPPLVQGSVSRATRPECVRPDFAALAPPARGGGPFPDALRNLQYRDARYTKLPRALRFADRVSMRSSIELREPFLDHRLFELALRQPASRKIGPQGGKQLLRSLAGVVVPLRVAEAPKRAVQTPQREWLRGPLRQWATAQIEGAIDAVGGSWLDARAVRAEWSSFLAGHSDNSFFVWQWISLGLMRHGAAPAARPAAPSRRSRAAVHHRADASQS